MGSQKKELGRSLFSREKIKGAIEVRSGEGRVYVIFVFTCNRYVILFPTPPPPPRKETTG